MMEGLGDRGGRLRRRWHPAVQLPPGEPPLAAKSRSAGRRGTPARSARPA